MPRHHTLFTSPTYKGLSVVTHRGPLVQQYLDSLYSTMHKALESNPRTFAVRIDLRFPKLYQPLEGEILSNEYIRRFKASLEAILDAHAYSRRREGIRVHDPDLRMVWAREYDHGDSKPHYHLLILLNQDAYHTLGHFGSDRDNMLTRIQEAWLRALRLKSFDARGLVHVPRNAQYRLRRDDHSGFADLFYRASYFCKVDSKRWCGGHPFGVSRK